MVDNTDYLEPPDQPDWIDIASKASDRWRPTTDMEHQLIAIIDGLLQVIEDETGLTAKPVQGTTGPH